MVENDSQKVLHPHRTGEPPPWRPYGPIPKHVRNFGYFPDVERLLPGDLLLVSALDPGLPSRLIIDAQKRGGYSIHDAKWHHAAMYFGEGLGNCLCEAVVKDGIRLSPLYDYIGTHELRFRRGPGLDQEKRWRIVVKGLTRPGETYSKTRILDLARQVLRRGFYTGEQEDVANATICSEFYADAYSLATDRVLKNPIGREATPAYLSCSPLLEDVDVGWRRIS